MRPARKTSARTLRDRLLTGIGMLLKERQHRVTRGVVLIGGEDMARVRQLHEPRAWYGACDDASVLGRHELIGFAVDDECRRGDRRQPRQGALPRADAGELREIAVGRHGRTEPLREILLDALARR